MKKEPDVTDPQIVKPMVWLQVDKRETITILAALLFWKKEALGPDGKDMDALRVMATGTNRIPELSAFEIDELCGRFLEAMEKVSETHDP